VIRKVTRLLVDSDVFAKLGIAGLLEEVLKLLAVTPGECGRLPALPHMLRRGGLPALYGAEACEALVPTADKMGVIPSASTEWLARVAGVSQIDAGEAQLFASAAEYGLLVLTGDKRSVIAMSQVDGFPAALAGRIISLESALLALCGHLGHDKVREALAPLVAIKDKKEKTIAVCFSDGNPDPVAALQSYFDDLKKKVAPLMLWQVPVEERG
jgi:hypothetical protein